MVASEASPWAKTGGLADVAGSLPEALERQGHDVTTVMPRYRNVVVPDSPKVVRRIALGRVAHDVTFHVVSQSPRRRTILVDVPSLFQRDGLYGTQGRDYPDNYERFGILAAAALDYAQEAADDGPIDIVHAHDWQAGLVPTLLRTHSAHYPRLRRAGLVFTIHNLAYQGLFDRDIVPTLGLPWTTFQLETGEFWGQFGFLKAGLAYSDFVTTVSPSYALETLRPEFGCGLEGVLQTRADRYLGILNGIDTEVWNPASDRLIAETFDAEHLEGKRACKRALLERFGFSRGDDALSRPLVGLVSRLVDQKGLDLIEQAAESLVDLDATYVFVGMGERRYEEFLRQFASRFPARVGVHIGFDEPLAHQVEAGADIFLMPSRFEPCGLNQMYSLRYGTVPVVHAVGGLDDTIQPYSSRARRANGFKFREATPEALVRTLRQAVRVFHDKAAWLPLMRAGMAENHSWQTAAREYVKVYRRARQAAALRPLV